MSNGGGFFPPSTQANPALDSGEIDLNLFQHLQFLAEYNVGTDSDLTPVGATLVVPLGLYSKKHTSVEDIPQGGSVAIPNDPSNQARALLVLQEAGLISLTGGGNSLSTPADIDLSVCRDGYFHSWPGRSDQAPVHRLEILQQRVHHLDDLSAGLIGLLGCRL